MYLLLYFFFFFFISLSYLCNLSVTVPFLMQLLHLNLFDISAPRPVEGLVSGVGISNEMVMLVNS